MQFAEVKDASLYQITGFDAKHIYINEQKVNKTLLLLPDKMLTSFDFRHFSELTATDINQLLLHAFELMIIGTGTLSAFLKPELLTLFHEKKRGVETMNTHSACRTYTILTAEARAVAALLFLPA